MPSVFEPTSLDGVIVVKPRFFKDDRGFFLETYKSSEFKQNGIKVDFVQDNHSFSTKNVLRGIHFQRAPHAQAKLVRVVHGAVLDVAVDLRPNSPTFLKSVSVELTAENGYMLFIPEGFGHGFLTLTESAHLMYKCSNEYNQASDGGIIWNDPDIRISWPISTLPLLSPKDQQLKTVKEMMEIL